MSFFSTLQNETRTERELLIASPLVQDALAGKLDRDTYAAFLGQAYHHVKHTIPLLMAAGSRIPGDMEWLRTALAEYVEEELGHQEWILNDIRACGYDAEAVRAAIPTAETELMVAYAYHVIDRGNPVGFFGMVHVLEGTSVSVADKAAECIAASTGLGPEAFSYLRSHGALDIEHVKFFEDLMNRIDGEEDQRAILHCAKMFYRLYANVYGSVRAGQATALAA
ncbi:TenA family transcriptional regulator [Pseudohalioglobus lutimaris]|uniref:Iron-containing redox enzyme family protein n=1 Tax=Pseudohalioglobus lutimaris TaxID=1737061 RepID=A0A2N5X3C0_9GAMM|nr:iron-containing redox enzyme family protein [Pseudohalioglobus lutimaris]PLW68963.1 iron-containing redox enzyme family protein [Pseudohalioglobus lutimaris]